MTVFKHPKGATFRYDFWWRGDRYTGNTLQTTRAEAQLVEAGLKKKLRLQAGGLAPPDPDASPRFQDWAEIYYEHVLTQLKDSIRRPERIEDLLRVVLRFWGARPPADATGKWAARADEPYHDLRLKDPIEDPMWLLRFEKWMAEKGVAGQTKNQYRSTLSQLYALAMQPAYRKRTGVLLNPFVGIPRDGDVSRTSTVSVDELRAWLQHASYHVALAVSIAALAPKLRLANVLKLRWGRDVDMARRLITVQEHKTAATTKKPLVVPIGDQLAAILDDARKRCPHAKTVVTYRGRAVQSIRGGVKAAAKAAGLTWGRFDEGGVTFHTVRHTMATLLAELPDLDGQPALSESVRMDAMGHERLETTQRYTHIRPAVERRALERLSKVTPIADVVTGLRLRASRKRRGTITGTDDSEARKTPAKGRKSRSTSRPSKIAS